MLHASYKSIVLTSVLALLGILTAHAQGAADPSEAQKQYPSKTQAVRLGTTPALRDLSPHTQAPQPPLTKTWSKRNYFFPNELRNPDALPKNGDPLVRKTPNTTENGPQIVPGLNLEGLSEEWITPPDPVGDVGLQHYMQMINSSGGSSFQIWDKQGQSVYGPAYTSTIWSQVGSGSIGDPIINYDHDAQRWVMMEMQGFGENQLVLAVSADSDPTGAWTAWRIPTQGFPDYPKLYIWHNAYYITVNEIVNTNQCAGYALNKEALLNGEELIDAYRFNLPNYQAIRYQPATGVDWIGGPPPPAGSPGMIFRVYDDAWDGGQDLLQLWEIFVDWTNPGNNYAFGPTNFPTAPFETRVCFGGGLFDCIEQPGHPAVTRITALENIIMFSAPYRRFDTHESIVLNHITDISSQVGDGGDAGMRWYELRRDSGDLSWYIRQQGTYAPDQENRFTGTLAMDAQGNIGAGYSTASQLTFPGLRITGRRISDPPGEMPIQEFTLVPGGKSHTGDNRWGDYSSMSVDPVDGKTFWFTGEYQPANKAWGTRIGTFQIRRDTFDITPEAIPSPISSALLNADQVSVQILNGGIEPASGFSAQLFVDQILIATETITGTLLPGETLIHTFQPNVNWNAIGEKHLITVVTNWGLDQFNRNDTVSTLVEKLTSFNAAIPGAADLPNLICTPDYTLKLLLRNASGLPMTSAEVRWRIGNQPQNSIFWTGNLAPGAQDTLLVPITGLTGTQSLFKAQVYLPNGQLDQDTTNDKISQKIYTNLSGAFLTAQATTNLGILSYEIRQVNNDLLDKGTFSSGAQVREICSANNTCYKIILRSTTFKWEGDFKLYDLFGNLLAAITNASPQTQTISFCTPNRKNQDVGAISLIQPISGPNLGAAEPVSVLVRNFGLQTAENVTVSWRWPGGNWNQAPLQPTIPAGAATIVSFPDAPADLSTVGQTYLLEIKATIAGDELPENDQKTIPILHKAQVDLAFLGIQARACNRPDENEAEILLENTGLSIIDSFEIEYTLNGSIYTYFIPQTYLLPGEKRGIVLSLANAQNGNNELAARITRVNAENQDQFADNDLATTQFEVAADRIPVELYIGLQEKPTETSWEFYAGNGTLIASGGGYAVNYLAVFETFCLENDSCYYFRLLDAAGNGFEGNALLLNKLTNQPIWNYNPATDTFSVSISSPLFCPSSPCADFVPDLQIQNTSGATTADGEVTAIVQGGTPPYRYSLNGSVPSNSNTFTGLSSGAYVLAVFDAGSCAGYYPFFIGTVGTNAQPSTSRAVEVTPNPTTDLVWVRIPALPGESEAICSLLNQQGSIQRTILLKRFDQELLGAFSLEKQPSGTYFLLVHNEKGQIIAQKKVLKI